MTIDFWLWTFGFWLSIFDLLFLLVSVKIGGSVVSVLVSVSMWFSPILDRGSSEGSLLVIPIPMWWVFPIFAGGAHGPMFLCLSDCQLRRY